MRVFNWDEFIREGKVRKASSVTIGVFDGVHKGHQVLIKKIVSQKAIPTIITFRQNPKKNTVSIFSLRQKLDIFRDLGVLQTVLIDFSEKFSTMNGQDFIDLLTLRGNMVYLAIGNGFRCGHNLDLNASLIKERNESEGRIKVEVVSQELDDEGIISSSRIREAIADGKLKLANSLLGRNFFFFLFKTCAQKEREYLFFNVLSRNRVVTPDGNYLALVHKFTGEKGRETEIVVKEGKIGIPSTFNVFYIKSIEFLSVFQGE
jgi:riboflavin kinase/FMN adenylyltransferase